MIEKQLTYDYNLYTCMQYRSIYADFTPVAKRKLIQLQYRKKHLFNVLLKYEKLDRLIIINSTYTISFYRRVHIKLFRHRIDGWITFGKTAWNSQYM